METSVGVWPDRLPAVEVRIARPTDKLGEVLDFYCRDLGLPELYRTIANGYHVVMVGLPGDKYHLEFTSHDDGSPGRAPSDENCSSSISPRRTRCSTSLTGSASADMNPSGWTTRGGARTGLLPSPTLTIGETC